MILKIISEFPNYKVSDCGKVFNKRGLELKQTTSKVGYKRVGLFNKTSKNKKMAVHRLMCQAFLPNFYNKPFVDHKNKIRNDNRLCNLRWVTGHENQQNRSFQKTNTTGHTNIRFRGIVWIFEKRFNSKLYGKGFKTLEEAINYRDNKLYLL